MAGVEVTLHARGPIRHYILAAATARLTLALERYLAKNPTARVAHLDVPYFAILAGLVSGYRRGRGRAEISPELHGELSAHILALADAPEAVPGWRIAVDRNASRIRLRCERLPDHAPAAAG